MANIHSITRLNETAALVSFGNVIDEEVNQKIIVLHQKLTRDPFEGFIESVPAYSSLAVFYHHRTFEFVEQILEQTLSSLPGKIENQELGTVEIPVLYDGDDLQFVAEVNKLSANDVIAIHTAKNYRVFMIGFLPGFPYMGTVDPRIATPRKETPRIQVKAGSIGIAGIQTGIYPQSSPGGWQLIGRTPLKIFDAERKNPCLLRAGDSVKFFPITQSEFQKINEY